MQHTDWAPEQFAPLVHASSVSQSAQELVLQLLEFGWDTETQHVSPLVHVRTTQGMLPEAMPSVPPLPPDSGVAPSAASLRVNAGPAQAGARAIAAMHPQPRQLGQLFVIVSD
jgi:hypothetical protein